MNWLYTYAASQIDAARCRKGRFLDDALYNRAKCLQPFQQRVSEIVRKWGPEQTEGFREWFLLLEDYTAKFRQDAHLCKAQAPISRDQMANAKKVDCTSFGETVIMDRCFVLGGTVRPPVFWGPEINWHKKRQEVRRQVADLSFYKGLLTQ